MRPRTLFHIKVSRQSFWIKWVKWEIQSSTNISEMGGDVKGVWVGGGALWYTGPQKLISILVLLPLASWAQVALALNSNLFGLSFMGKGKYGLLLANPLLRHAVFVWARTCVGGWNKETARKISTISKKKTKTDLIFSWGFPSHNGEICTFSHYKQSKTG